jgi:3-hydroxybutyryl-CoA dehydrogenase
MGRGIAETAARTGHDTILFDLEENILQTAKMVIEKSLQQQVISSRMNEGEKNATLERIHFTNNISQCKGDIVIEAIVESPEPKIELFTYTRPDKR